MARTAPLFGWKPRTARLLIACVGSLALVATACAAQTSDLVISEQAMTTTTLPYIPDPGERLDEAEFVDAEPQPTPEPLPDSADFAPWSTRDLLAGLGGGGAELALSEVLDLAVADIETFWEQEFEEQWDFGFVPVETKFSYDAQSVRSDELPECLQDADPELLVNAFYCFFEDTISWDEGVLFPYLQQAFGYLAPALVLAHEYGHAIQARLGTWLDSVVSSADVILELQADCYEGAWLGDLISRGGGELGISGADVDRAFQSLAQLGDAPGSRATGISAHGTSFDRMAALRQGLVDGIGSCVRYVETLPTITSSGFSDSELENLGNLPMGEVLPLVVADLEDFWSHEFERSFGTPYESPDFIPIAPRSGFVEACGGLEADPAGMQGLATYCSEGHILVDAESLLPTLEPTGDLALSYPIIHAWSLQVLMQGVGSIPSAGPILTGDCVSGVWLRGMWEGRGQLDLSAGDIDEAVRTFSLYTPTAPNGVPVGEVPSVLDRVGAFSRGFLSGTEACLV
jgi:predicted metalloprotease